MYCGKTFASVDINLLKHHLGGIKEEMEQCLKCLLNIHHQMLLKLQRNVKKEKRSKDMQDNFTLYSSQQMNNKERMII